MKKKKYTIGTVQKSNRIIFERCKIDTCTPNTDIQDTFETANHILDYPQNDTIDRLTPRDS